MAATPAQELDGLDEALAELKIYVDSALLRAAVEKVSMVADYDAPALIWGETGTGKELFAKLIHGLGDRQHRPLAALNCTAIPRGARRHTVPGRDRRADTERAWCRRAKWNRWADCR